MTPQKLGDAGKQPDGAIRAKFFSEFHLLIIEQHNARGSAHAVGNGVFQAIAVIADQMPFGRRIASQGNGLVVRTPGRARQGQREDSAILYPVQYLLPQALLRSGSWPAQWWISSKTTSTR